MIFTRLRLSLIRRQPIGKKQATIAVAHSILVICRHLLTHDCDYDDLGGDYFTRRNADRQRDRLIHQLAGLGYYVTLDKIGQADHLRLLTSPASERASSASQPSTRTSIR